jgi:hypothetical protein
MTGMRLGSTLSGGLQDQGGRAVWGPGGNRGKTERKSREEERESGPEGTPASNRREHRQTGREERRRTSREERRHTSRREQRGEHRQAGREERRQAGRRESREEKRGEGRAGNIRSGEAGRGWSGRGETAANHSKGNRCGSAGQRWHRTYASCQPSRGFHSHGGLATIRRGGLRRCPSGNHRGSRTASGQTALMWPKSFVQLDQS